MKAIQLRPYQTKAILAIQEALMHDQKRVAIEMPTGFGKGMVFAKTIEHLQKTNVNKILVVVGNLNLKEKITREILANYNGFVSINSSNIVIETEHRLLCNSDERVDEYNIIVFYDATFRSPYGVSASEDQTVIVFSTFGNDIVYENKISTKPYFQKILYFHILFKKR